MVSKVRTGDLLLFSSKHSTSFITKYFTKSRWDHIGIVVKPCPTKAYLIEWGNGLFACELVERLTEYAECDALELVLRTLTLPEGKDRRRVEDRIEAFVDMLFREEMGTNRGIPMGEVINAAIGQMSGASTSYAKDKEVVVDDLKHLFCSKTVAVAYKAAGLLAPNRLSDRFLPKHFSAEYGAFLDLQGGASLGPEQRVTFASRRMRDAVQFMLAHPLLEFVADPRGVGAQEDRAAKLVQKFVRRLAARRELRRRRTCGGEGAEAENEPLYGGAKKVTTKERATLLRRRSLEPRSKPSEALHMAGIDEDGVGATNEVLL